MKKETILFLMLGASLGQFLFNIFFKGKLWIPTLVAVYVLVKICTTPKKILEEEL